MIVENTKVGLLIVPMVVRNVVVKNIHLIPGNNEVPAGDWSNSRDLVKDKIELGVVIEHGSPEIEEYSEEWENEKGKKYSVYRTRIKKVKNFREMSLRDSEDIVKKTYNMETLLSWKKRESRDSIRLALMNQIEAVENYGKAGKKVG